MKPHLSPSPPLPITPSPPRPFLLQKPGAIIIEGHIQGLSNTRSLGEADIPVYVVDKTTCLARYSRYCRKFFTCPDFLSDEFATFLIDLAKKEKLKDWLLLPSNDHAVITLSKHKTRLAKYYKVITPDPEVIDNIYDKSKLLEIASENKIPIPQTYYFESATYPIPAGIQYPVITRGRFGLSFYKAMGKKALLADNENQLRNQFTMISGMMDLKNILIQEVIPDIGKNKTISFTAFCIDGEIKTHWAGVKLREHPHKFGTATFAKSIFSKECLDQSRVLLKALNYYGICEVEYLQDPRDNQYKLIEINARTWLWVGLAKACGVDYAKILYNYVHGLENNYPENYKTGLCWINSMTDILFSLKAILSGRLSPVKYLKSLTYKIILGVFRWDDILPGVLIPFIILLRVNKTNHR